MKQKRTLFFQRAGRLMPSALHPKPMRIFLCAFLIISGPTAFAQLSVRGTVTSKTDGQPLPGVSVNVAWMQIGVNTDLEGRYAFDVTDENSVIEFTFLVLKALKIKVYGKIIIY